MAAMQLHWDIFCRVIDNYGDIGVCWRLARQLAAEHGKQVRLWLDDLNSLQPFYPAIDVTLARQQCQGVDIIHWTETVTVDRVGEVVVEAFACELPAAYLDAMAQTAPPPGWINLEYLTAESWAVSCHGLASPHPSLPLTKYFFFPGFSARTGGLLREEGLLAKRERERAQLQKHGGLDISLFCYDTAPVGALLDLLAESPTEVRLHVAPGKPLAAVATHLGGSGPWQRGMLSVLPFTFLPQMNTIACYGDATQFRARRGFFRSCPVGWAPFFLAITAGGSAHIVKLEAFLALATLKWSNGSECHDHLHRAWNSAGDLRRSWADFCRKK